MANTQIAINTNGTTTLATAGKYCDRNIDVNVDVPASGITPTGTVSITTNGTHDVTNYASAVVDVPTAQPTQFTNYYDPANVVLNMQSDCSSANGLQITANNYVNYVVISYHHEANEPLAIRIRGLSTPVRDRQGFTVFKSDGVTPDTWGQFSSCVTLTYDEYGDAVLTAKGVLLTREWYYLHLNFQYIGINSGATEAKTGPIITINEPIGNGGHV